MTKMFYDGAKTLQERINLNIGSGISSLITYLMMGRNSQEVQEGRRHLDARDRVLRVGKDAWVHWGITQ